MLKAQKGRKHVSFLFLYIRTYINKNMKTSTFLLGLALAIVSCGQGSTTTGYTIKGTVKNCGEWGNDGRIVLVTHDNGKRISDTVDIINGHFMLTGYISTPDFASLHPVQSDTKRPAGQILFFLENEKYSIKIKNGVLNGQALKGGTTQKLLNEVREHQKNLYEKYSIESIDRQLNTTGTPAYRMEKLKVVRNEYNNEVKAYKDSIILANTPSYFSLYMTSQMISDESNLDSVMRILITYLKDDKYKDDPRLLDMIEIIEEKRRP